VSASVTVKFSMENDAFHDPNGSYGDEAARILQVIADRIRRGGTGGKVLDVNGNTVGTWKVR
jgi:hypothetical protein